ncbi:hypothetical protein BG011_008401 [Mortierella polycephala]|uniref:BHLH domain-containing protein n=1 Tax=Mortierella polycephala TaxID=41804 RepID=A0A9P6TXG7_9FUNG|nr:hypothetical protein BG011_008401 [Mortierella polycephala]
MTATDKTEKKKTKQVAGAAAAASKAKAAKTTKATKATKAAKAQTPQESSPSSSDKDKSAQSKPKVFRFEGSISSDTFKVSKSFDLGGVNILNRKPLDTKAALDKIQRRRETHNRVERKRRDCINQLVDDLTKLLPPEHLEGATSKCHRVNVLRGAVAHIKHLSESNETLSKSIQAINGDNPLAIPLPMKQEYTANESRPRSSLSMDVDMSGNDDDDDDEDMDEDLSSTQGGNAKSRSISPSSVSSTAQSVSSSAVRNMVPPPVIITDAPSPSVEHDPLQNTSAPADAFSLDSRPRSNSFASSVGDQPSPKNAYPSSPNFPPSPISPSTGTFDSGENHADKNLGSGMDQQRLTPFMGHSPSPSPSLPPISSLANLQLQSPSGHMNESTGEDHSLPTARSGPSSTAISGRGHRGAGTLPPLTIPEPHHLHPSYHHGGAPSSSTGSNGSNNSNRNSLTLSPRSADHPPISPFMLSPLQPRSPPTATLSISPGSSPLPNWTYNGSSSPQMYPSHGSPFAHPYPPPYGYPYPGPMDPSYPPAYSQHYSHHAQQYQQQQQQPQLVQTKQKPQRDTKHHARHKSLQPESIFIQEEPWNVQRKRSTSSASGRAAKQTAAAALEKKKAADVAVEADIPLSPTGSVTSMSSLTTGQNPKKRMQVDSHGEDVGEDEETPKRTKQGTQERVEGTHQRDSGVLIAVVEKDDVKVNTQTSAVSKDVDRAVAKTDMATVAADEDAAHALAFLARAGTSTVPEC